MQQQQQQNGSSGLGATLTASTYQQQQQQQGSIPAGRGPAAAAGRSTEQQQQQQQQQAGAYRVNPMFGEAAVLSPDKKVDREYTPRLADAIRTPSLDALVPGASLPPVGDLFADQPELPLSAEAVLHTAPKLPDWDTQRASLTGRSLWDEAVAHSRAGGAAKEDDSKPQVLETYPPHVQESLRKCQHCPAADRAAACAASTLCQPSHASDRDRARGCRLLCCGACWSPSCKKAAPSAAACS
jgi:hypothetical protein